MNPAFDDPFLPNPFAPAPETEAEVQVMMPLRDHLDLMARKDAEIAALKARIHEMRKHRDEYEQARQRPLLSGQLGTYQGMTIYPAPPLKTAAQLCEEKALARLLSEFPKAMAAKLEPTGPAFLRDVEELWTTGKVEKVTIDQQGAVSPGPAPHPIAVQDIRQAARTQFAQYLAERWDTSTLEILTRTKD